MSKKLPDVGDRVLFHGKVWTVTAWEDVGASEDEDSPCRYLTVEYRGDNYTDTTYVDACAVRPSPKEAER